MKPRSFKTDDPADSDFPDGPAESIDEGTSDEVEPTPFGSERTGEEPIREPVLEPTEPTAPAQQPQPPHEVPPPNLELRVRRLEEALALLQQGKPVVVPTPSSPGTAGTPTRGVPVASVTEQPDIPTATPIPTASPGGSRPVPTTEGRGHRWLFWEMFIELRVFLRMYTDPRYQMSWLCRLLPPFLFAVFLFPDYIVPLAMVPLLGWFVAKLGAFLAAYVLFKILIAETRRYRQTAPDLPASMRL